MAEKFAHSLAADLGTMAKRKHSNPGPDLIQAAREMVAHIRAEIALPGGTVSSLAHCKIGSKGAPSPKAPCAPISL